MADDKSPAFQLYTKDLISDANVLAMNLTEFGAYVKLMAICWNERGLPGDLGRLAKILSITLHRLEQLWPAIEPCFYLDEQGRYQHKRLDKERRKQQEYREAQSEAGKRGAQARWQDGGAMATPSSETGKPTVPPMANDGFAVCSLQSASASADQEQPARAKDRSHRGHGWCGDGRKCVPQSLHDQFVAEIGGDPNTRLMRLIEFYEGVMREIPVNDAIGDDPWKFWRAHFAAAFPSRAPTARAAGKTAGNQEALQRFVERRLGT